MNMHTTPEAAPVDAKHLFNRADELCEDIRRADELRAAYKIMDELEIDRDEVLHILGIQIRSALDNAEKLADLLRAAS